MKAGKKIQKKRNRREQAYDLYVSTVGLQGDAFKKFGPAGFKRPGSNNRKKKG